MSFALRREVGLHSLLMLPSGQRAASPGRTYGLSASLDCLALYCSLSTEHTGDTADLPLLCVVEFDQLGTLPLPKTEVMEDFDGTSSSVYGPQRRALVDAHSALPVGRISSLLIPLDSRQVSSHRRQAQAVQ